MNARLVCIPLFVLALACAGIPDEDIIPPDVQLSNLVLQDATLFEQRVRVDLRIINPNDFKLPIDGVTFDLLVNGERVARGSSPKGVTIPRLGDGVLGVETTTNSVAMVRTLINQPKSGDFEYEITGDVFLKGFGRRKVPFEHKGKLPTVAPGPTTQTP